MQKITVRYRIAFDREKLGYTAFSSRSYQSLSLGAALAAEPGEAFAELDIEPGSGTLAEAIYLSGHFAAPALCSGLGRCGLCRVRFISEAPEAGDEERQVLSHHDLDAGWRLACRCRAQAGQHVVIPALLGEQERLLDLRSLSVKKAGFCALAVDLGTTSVHWRLAPLEGTQTGEEYPGGILPNPQMGAGSDVISRLALAEKAGGAGRLRFLAQDLLRRLVREAGEADLPPTALCVAANPAMSAILLGLPVKGLAGAPYSLPDPGGRKIDLPGLPPLYIPPHISPFIGSDISAGYAHLALDPEREKAPFPFLLADLGTNGECILALSEHEALAVSLPMGPALEGINLAYGMEARTGAVTEFCLSPTGLQPIVMGDTAPAGIAATGYLSLLRSLKASGLLREDGSFSLPESSLSHRVAGEAGKGDEEPRLRLPGKMFLFASDVEEILKVKAAFTLAVSTLLREAGLSPATLKRVFLAGSLGSHAPLLSLVDLGFLPGMLGAKTEAAGNTALAGAALLLRHEEIRPGLEDWASKVSVLNLAGESGFGGHYARHMVFAWRS